MRSTSLVAALFAGLALAPSTGGAVVVHRGISDFLRPNQRAGGYRQGRRSRAPVRKGGNPAGTKLARKAYEGKLTIVGIR